MSQSKVTTDHNEIRRWVEEREGKPAKVVGAEGPGDLLRIDFPGGEEESLEEMSWDEFFEQFENSKLAFLYQDEPESRFNKLVHR